MLTKKQFNYVLWITVQIPLNAWAADQDPVVLDAMEVVGDNASINRFEDPPLSAQIFLRREIEERHIKAVQDLMDDIPNFHVSSAGSRGPNNIFSIRGLTNTLVFGNAPISIYVDDVPFGDPFTFANHLYGVESIEVFRGPQSTLFGKNSYGGAFNITNRRPGEELQGELSVAGGNFDDRAVNGYFSGPLVQNQLAFSLAGAYSKRDGFLNNTFLHIRADNREYTGGRGSLIWTPSNAWHISFSGSLNNFDDGAGRIVPVDGEPFTIQSNLPGETKQFIDTEALRIRYLARAFVVLSVTARRNWKLDPRIIDLDLTPASIAQIETRENVRQWSQEVRIQSPEHPGEWDWRIGVFGLFSEDKSSNVLTLFGGSEATQDKIDENSYAGFGFINYRGFANTELNFGLRMDYVYSRIDRKRQGGPFGPIPAGLEKQQDSFFLSVRNLALTIGLCPRYRCMAQPSWLLNRADSPPRI